MNETENDSDVSSNSSWTVLDEQAESRSKSDGENTPIEERSFTINSEDLLSEIELLNKEDLSDGSQIIELSQDCSSQNVNQGKEGETHSVPDDKPKCSFQNGCLTLDEFLEGHELIHEFDDKEALYDKMLQKQAKKDKNKRRKYMSEQIGVITIISTVLAVAGVSFLCLLCPNPASLTPKEIKMLKAEYNATEAFNKTMDAAPTLTIMHNKIDDKYNLVDDKGILHKYLGSNATNPQEVHNCVKNSRVFREVPTINLQKANDTKTKLYGPITYEEYIKESEQRLHNFRKPKPPTRIAKLKNWDDLEVCPRLDNPKAVVDQRKNTSLIILADKPSVEESAPKIYKAKAKDCRIKRSKEDLIIIPPTRSNTLKTNLQVDEVKEITKVEETQHLESKTLLGKPDDLLGTVARGSDLLQDLMLLRITSKALKRFNKKQKSSQTKKSTRLKKKSSHELSAAQSSVDQMPPVDSSVKHVNETNRVIPKLSTFNVTLDLLDELPFSQRNATLSICAEKENDEGVLLKGKLASTRIAVDRTPSILLHPADLRRRVDLNEDGRHYSSQQRRAKCLENINRDIQKRMEYLNELRQSQDSNFQYLLARDLATGKFKIPLCAKYNPPVARAAELSKNLRKVNSNECAIKAQPKNAREKFRDACCGNYQVPIPTATEINKKLLDLNSKSPSSYCCNFSFEGSCQSKPRVFHIKERKVHIVDQCRCGCCSNTSEERQKAKTNDEMMYKNLIDEVFKRQESYQKKNCSDRGAGLPRKSTFRPLGSYPNLMDLRMKLKNPPKEIKNSEHTELKKKFYEQMRSYWHKREEYLEERIHFMKRMSASVEEIVDRHKYINAGQSSDDRDREVLTNLIRKASEAFPCEGELEKLKNKMIDLNKARLARVRNCDSEKTSSTGLLDRPCTLANAAYSLVQYKESAIKDDAFYKWVFGRKGQQIRKRDLALWYYNKISERKSTGELRCRDVRAFNKSKKSKKAHMI